MQPRKASNDEDARIINLRVHLASPIGSRAKASPCFSPLDGRGLCSLSPMLMYTTNERTAAPDALSNDGNRDDARHTDGNANSRKSKSRHHAGAVEKPASDRPPDHTALADPTLALIREAQQGLMAVHGLTPDSGGVALFAVTGSLALKHPVGGPSGTLVSTLQVNLRERKKTRCFTFTLSLSFEPFYPSQPIVIRMDFVPNARRLAYREIDGALVRARQVLCCFGSSA